MKVLLVNKFLFPKGGDAICTLATGELLQSRGHRVAYWGMAHPENPTHDFADLFVPHVDLNAPQSLGEQIRIARNIVYSRVAREQFTTMIDRFAPDIVHLHNFAHQISPSIVDVIKERGIPAVMTMHDYKLVCAAYTMISADRPCERCRDGRFHQAFIRRCIKNSYLKSLVNTVEMICHHRIWHIYDPIRLFIAPSRFLMDKVKEMGFRGQTVHLANFVDPAAFITPVAAPGEGFCYFGRLSREKGLETLLKAARGSRIPVKIIGDGPMRETLEAEAAMEGMENVRFLGYMTGEALQREIAASLAVVLPSEWYENNPLSILEAFVLAKPVIGARIGGIPELVREGEFGHTFTPGNAEELRAKMVQCVAHPRSTRDMGIAARAYVTRRHDPETYLKGLLAIYADAGIHDRAGNATAQPAETK